MADNLLESQGKILAWEGKKPLYQADFDIKWKNVSESDLLKHHKEYKSQFQSGSYSGKRGSVYLTKRMPQKFNLSTKHGISKIHLAFHSAKSLETELSNRKISYKPIELKLPITKRDGLKTQTNIFQSLLKNVNKLGPALKFSGKLLPVIGPLLQITEMKKQYEGLMKPKEPTIY